MNDFLSALLQWLNANPGLSGLGVFLISAAESVAIIGTIVPGSVMMTAIGTLAGAGVIPLWPTIIWAILGAIVGDGISYWLGYHFKDRIHDIWPFRKHPQVLKKGEQFFHKHGGKSVFIGRFVGPVRALVPLVAGMFGMTPFRFYVANIISAIGWAPAYMLPGILLGAASLELPPDIAVHAILMMLLVGLFIILCVWLIYKFFVLVNAQINNSLNLLWTRLKTSRYTRSLTVLLKHHDPKKTHGQLTLAFYLILVCILFLTLACYVKYVGSNNIALNNSFFYLSRSLRTPLFDNIMLAITFLGETTVLAPLAITLFVWFAYTKRWYAACHVFVLGLLVLLGCEYFKHHVHSLRPWGIVGPLSGFSFPSGHTTIATAFFGGIGLLLVEAFQIKNRKLIYSAIVLVAFFIGVSRIYLGAHWFTDVLGGWLLGSAIVMIITLSFHRKPEKSLDPKGIVITVFLTLLVTYSTMTLLKFHHAKIKYAQRDWPTYTVSQQSWWNQHGDYLPLYRVNRFGLSTEILNLQWLGHLNEIELILLKNGWEIPPKRDWINVLHRVTDFESAEHLPLVDPLYLDEKPALVLTKQVNGDKKLIVLRLWQAHVIFANSSQPLWVGTVDQSPRTYSWLFRRKTTSRFIFSSNALFNKNPTQYEIRSMTVKLNNNTSKPMLLIKPK
jgi:membrane protein DedA with SNARE-associated domain/membrane-associated phospholipid phosphatase